METNKEERRTKLVKVSFREASSPEPVEKIKQKIVHWGLDNLHGQELVGYRQDNPIHGGIVNQKVTFMSSAGAEVSGLDGQEGKMMEILPSVVDDFETFNGYAVLFIRSGDTWKIDHVDFESIRYKDHDNLFAISDDWSAKTQSLEKTNYREIKDLAFANLLGDNPDKELLFYSKVKPKQRKLKNGKLSLCYYPIPVYAGAIVSILAGIEQDYFALSESISGYKGGTYLSLNNGQPDDDDKANEMADSIKEQATDRDRQGGMLIGFSDGADNAPTVLSLNGNDLDKRYIESNREIRSKILIGHSAGSPTLFGVNSEAVFGSKEEMETAYALFSNNYVNGRQEFISAGLEWAFTRVGVSTPSIVFNKYVLTLASSANEDNAILDQLNSMSPLLSMKVLDSMSPDEIRALAKLAPRSTAMSSELHSKYILKSLASMGIPREGIEIMHRRPFDLESSDEEFLASVNKFAELTQNQQTILKLIGEGKSFSEISKELGKGALALSIEIVKLNAKGLLSGWKLTPSGKSNMEVRYSYEVKSGLGASLIPTSREFCVDLITLDRLYTRAEIDILSNELETDVWRYRGGWYSNPKTGRTTPSCRHEWAQNIVRV
jgi:hypothetical protein